MQRGKKEEQNIRKTNVNSQYQYAKQLHVCRVEEITEIDI